MDLAMRGAQGCDAHTWSFCSNIASYMGRAPPSRVADKAMPWKTHFIRVVYAGRCSLGI